MLLEATKAFDIIVGIPSYKEEDNIAFVTKIVDEGLTTHYPDKNCLIVNMDNSPDDLTKKEFLKTPTKNSKLYLTARQFNKGKGANIRLLLEITDKFNAPTTIMVDADLRSITPEWIKILSEPIIKGYDLVTPLYSRNHLDGTITNNIVYPLVYGLIGKNLRQPIGGEFAFSLRTARFWLSQEWLDSTYRYGIDNFMTITALINDFKTCQAGLGAKIHKPSAPKLNQMFTEVTDTLFWLLSKDPTRFEKRELTEIPVVGKKLAQPQELTVNEEAIKTTMYSHWELAKETLKEIIPPARFEDLETGFINKKPYLNPYVWTELVYTLLAAYYKQRNNKEATNKIIESLKPLYFARVLSFIEETRKMTEEQAEAQIRHQAHIFWEKREYYFSLIKHIKKQQTI